MNKNITQLTAIGWREWVSFPLWGIDYLKAKVDTGARTSSLHVRKIEYYEYESKPWIRFNVYPWQETTEDKKRVELPIISYKEVRSSSGIIERRPVVRTKLIVSGMEIEADLTLTNRSQMGFRMLLGREAIKRNYIIYPGQSYLGGKPPKPVLLKNRGGSDKQDLEVYKK